MSLGGAGASSQPHGLDSLAPCGVGTERWVLGRQRLLAGTPLRLHRAPGSCVWPPLYLLLESHHCPGENGAPAPGGVLGEARGPARSGPTSSRF